MKKCKYPKLSGKITEVYGTQKLFAEALGISETSLTAKLKGRSPWKQSEIASGCNLLNIPKEDVMLYFFV